MGLRWQIKKSGWMQLSPVLPCNCNHLTQWHHQQHHTSPYKYAECQCGIQVQNKGKVEQEYEQAGESWIGIGTILSNVLLKAANYCIKECCEKVGMQTISGEMSNLQGAYLQRVWRGV